MFHTYGLIITSHTACTLSWCTVQCTPLHYNNSKFAIHLMIAGLLSTALFQYLKCQDQRICKNCRSTFIFCSSWNLWGGPFFKFSLPRGAARTPASPSVTPLVISNQFFFDMMFLLLALLRQWSCSATTGFCYDWVCTMSGFISLVFLCSGCVPCSSFAHRAPGKKATVLIYKFLLRPSRDSNSRRTSTEADALTLDQAFPTFLLPCTPSAFQQVSMYPFRVLTDVHVPLRYPMTIHFIMIIHWYI